MYNVQCGIDKDNTDVISWQDSATFTDLSIDTDYAFYLRYHVDEPKTDNYSNNGYSSVGPEAIFSLKPDAYAPPEKAKGFTINYIEETITILNGYEAAIDVNFAEDTLLNTGDRITPGTVVYIRFAATTDAPPSPATSNILSSRPATPAKPTITQTATTLTITNGTAQQEYKFEKNTTGIHSATFGVWQSSSVFTDDAMTEGDCYTITTRIKATSSSFASEGTNTVYQSQSIPADNPCTDNESATDDRYPNSSYGFIKHYTRRCNRL